MKAFLPFFLLPVLLSSQPKPSDVGVGTWVREDLFAGMIANDKQRLEHGLTKLDIILKADPNDASAIAWRGCGEFITAVYAFEAGDTDRFTKGYATAEASF